MHHITSALLLDGDLCARAAPSNYKDAVHADEIPGAQASDKHDDDDEEEEEEGGVFFIGEGDDEEQL